MGEETSGAAPIGAGLKGGTPTAQGVDGKKDDRVWPKADPAALKKWQDMRFGMFIHWGPVALTGQEISWSRGKKTPIDVYDIATVIEFKLDGQSPAIKPLEVKLSL